MKISNVIWIVIMAIYIVLGNTTGNEVYYTVALYVLVLDFFEYLNDERLNFELEKKKQIMRAMAEEISIKRAYALTGTKKAEEEIEDWKDEIVKEYERKFEE